MTERASLVGGAGTFDAEETTQETLWLRKNQVAG